MYVLTNLFFLGLCLGIYRETLEYGRLSDFDNINVSFNIYDEGKNEVLLIVYYIKSLICGYTMYDHVLHFFLEGVFLVIVCNKHSPKAPKEARVLYSTYFKIMRLDKDKEILF